AAGRIEDTHGAPVVVTTGALSRGFRLPAAALQFFAETDIFGVAAARGRPAPRTEGARARAFAAGLRDLKPGDHVVHVDHGVGLFTGLRRLAVGGETHEVLELRYAGDDKLYLPIERLDLIERYTGGARPTLDRLGGVTWERAKARVRRAMRDMAEELLKLYAARKAVAGHAFSPDTHWQREFEDAFQYELTPDQRAAIDEIKRDMEAPVPMDRLLCGDVGYGKTEVAMRAAFKAVLDGKQVAFLAPTTVLAFQHLKTLRERFAGFPVTIELVSRFRTRAEQKQVLADLAAGRVDIVVGTHRLLSKDVVFRDLGLLIVDEEQRFGVAHKERLKQLRTRVDVLTMTATPIPRTLNMALAGIRDMSIIETPPKDRLAIQTSVVKFDPQVIARAIRNELERHGQVYVVHNRVESIHSVASLVSRLVPEARVAVAHGQMSEEALERVMVDFVAHKYDVLVATTIVENGLDIPNANTIIVNRADRYGLAQLYQLRGRVGRSDRRAYAYLLIPPEEGLSAVARKRLAAIREFSDLGSGFRVAALDLEIRGAGNLLGGEQSGHIEAVGLETYMKLLEQTIRELKGEPIEEPRRAAVNLRVDLRIDERYVPDMSQRLAIYRRAAGARDEAELERLLDEVRDRYGPLPDSVLNLADYARIRLLADRIGLESLDRTGTTVVARFRQDAPLDAAFLVRFVQARGDVRLTPPATLTLDLEASAGRDPAARSGARRRERSEASWWTARALAGEV
ncbi:MAG TPA: transcription-repair coupling factor, partial [Vicinamibacterales bacterium]|nr:transcription-repair coupling factor [Vicinamibacterales bacterium]